jgi:hypothetical protein
MFIPSKHPAPDVFTDKIFKHLSALRISIAALGLQTPLKSVTRKYYPGVNKVTENSPLVMQA